MNKPLSYLVGVLVLGIAVLFMVQWATPSSSPAPGPIQPKVTRPNWVPKEIPQDPYLAKLMEIQSRHERDILRVSGVSAIGIGFVNENKDLGFVVYYEKGTLTQEMKNWISEQLEGIPVRFIEGSGPARFL